MLSGLRKVRYEADGGINEVSLCYLRQIINLNYGKVGVIED